MNMAIVYIYNSVWLVITASRSIDRFWFHDGECTSLALSVSDSILGRAIREHLAMSRNDVRQHIKTGPVNLAVLRAVGESSWQAFEKKVRTLDIRSSDMIRILPYGKYDKNSGFEPRHELEVVLAQDVTDHELGRVVREVLRSSS